ncbi:MAG: hypothetical protein QG608_1853 [Actinomycetota bacterium]|nr:hypothetical protein [Actinomycetota bacterium]
MKSPTGAEPAVVAVHGDGSTGTPMVAGDHWIEAPLDHRDPASERLRLFAREVRSAEHAHEDQPYLLYLQGGPGSRSPRPGDDAPAWLNHLLSTHRVVLLDQRGTGLSTPQDRHTLAALPAAVAADRLTHFRADSIVRDAELLRRHLLGDAPWRVLGQSFGGFCAWTYLGLAPQGLDRVMVTGGIPPVGRHPDDVYRATHRALARRVEALDRARPQARRELARIARHVEKADERLPGGERLTPARLQEIGRALGGAAGVDRIGILVEDAWALPGEKLSDTFLDGVRDIVGYSGQPLYALLHEAVYAEGGVRTGWSARRIRDELGIGTTDSGGPDGVERLELTGEMVYPHDLTADPALAPLAEVGELLAERVWSEPLYDRQALTTNDVPVAACVYTQDMYVDPEFSLGTARVTGAVRVVRDDVHHHDGLRRDGAGVLGRLAAALEGEPTVEERQISERTEGSAPRAGEVSR